MKVIISGATLDWFMAIMSLLKAKHHSSVELEIDIDSQTLWIDGHNLNVEVEEVSNE